MKIKNYIKYLSIKYNIKLQDKLISSKPQLADPKQDLCKQNFEIANKNNDKSEQKIDNIYPIINGHQRNIKNSKLNNINEKYKQIESKYINDIKEITKEDTLFNEEDIKSLNVKKEIIGPYIYIDEDIEHIPAFNNNINSQILKNNKEGRNPNGSKHNKNIIVTS